MGVTATTSFSEARRNLTSIADRVANEGVEYTVFKRSKPLFKIVPVSNESADDRAGAQSVTRSLRSASSAYPWTRAEAAKRAYERGSREGHLSTGAEHALSSQPPSGDQCTCIPDGGEELLEFAMRLRAQSGLRGKMTNLTPDEVKRELADRDV